MKIKNCIAHSGVVLCIVLSCFVDFSFHNHATAFAPSSKRFFGGMQRNNKSTDAYDWLSRKEIQKPYFAQASTRASTTITAIASPIPSAVKSAIPLPPLLRNALVTFTFLLVLMQRRRIFYPGSLPDPLYSEPLPPGSIGGCPWMGHLGMYSNMNKFFSQKASNLGKSLGATPKIWKMFGLGKPMAVVSGSSTIKQVLSREFKKEKGVSQVKTDFGDNAYMKMMFGTESMSSETSEASKYHFLRKLVGQSLTPESVAKGIPALQKASDVSVDRILESDNVVMEDVCKYLTLDVARLQIIGLDLKDDKEIQDFHNAVKVWLKGTSNLIYFILPFPAWIIRTTKEYKSKEYLRQKIEEKIDDLEKNGPDGSTISAMVFATDEDDKSKKLSRQQIIDNVLLLIVAGSETSALTLTNAVLLLGMYPGEWNKLVAEQEQLVSKHGPDLTKDQIDKECPYLDAVVKETMRMLPASAGGIRKVEDSLVLDGHQIPKKWWTMYSMALTHEQDPKTWKEDGSHMDIKLGFEPGRWLDDETKPTTEFIPFGAGHRFCLGHNLASAEMRTFLAVMARRIKSFDLKTNVDKMKWKEGVILTPKDGCVIAAHGS